jgi:dTDP-4-dehydrorhamnose 3,5-epimerase
MIKDVKLENLVVRSDDRGYLIEILRATDPHFTKFGQVYLVGNLTRGTIRAFHKHDELWDWFFISHGCAKFALYDDRPESPTYKETNTFIIGERQPGLLVVPPGVYHGWMSLQDDTQLISTGSEVYNREKPDEVRVPFDSFGYDWSVQFK